MESKTKHRILGIVVVAGLAILMYPFVQGNNSIPSEQAMVKAPPFPDQAIQVTSAVNDAVASTPEDTISSASVTAAAPSTEQVDNSTTLQPDGAISQDNPNIVNTVAPEINSIAAPASTPLAATPEQLKPIQTPEVKSSLQSVEQPASEADDQSLPNGPTSLSADIGNVDGPSVDDIPSVETNSHAAAKSIAAKPAKAAKVSKATKAAKKDLVAKLGAHKKLVKTAKANLAKPVVYSKIASKSGITAYRQMPIDNNGLVQLKQAAYVIQLGSFTEKTNALKLVNKLRAKGYRAFIQHTPDNVGENTRVFVGPEKQQASARLVATELEKEMQLHGIVISYKPFSL